MSDDIRLAVLDAWRLALRPLARILLRTGVTWKEATDCSKRVFVETATADFGLHGRETSISRVAILTGMTRREVSRLRQKAARQEQGELVQMNTATRVLTGWHLDPEFLDGQGRPLDLPFDGREASFVALARRYAGDIAPVTIMKELARVGALTDAPEGRLRVVKRYYQTSDLDPAKALQAGSMLEDFGNAVRHNLLRDADAAPRFVGRATNAAVRAADLPAFEEFLEREGQAFLERVDAWLSAHEVDPAAARRARATRVGVGVFDIRDDD